MAQEREASTCFSTNYPILLINCNSFSVYRNIIASDDPSNFEKYPFNIFSEKSWQEFSGKCIGHLTKN